MYGSKSPSSSARESRLLSIPKRTSPCGFPFVSSARLTISPASPPCRIVSFSPLSCSNAAFTSFGIANESCVTSTTSLLSLSPEPPQPAATNRAARPPAHPDLVTKRHEDASRSGPGWTAIRQPRATVTWASVAAKTFETPRLVPAAQGLAVERVLEPARRDALGRAVEGEQRDDLAGRARQRPRAADHRDPVVVEVRVDRRRSRSGRRRAAGASRAGGRAGRRRCRSRGSAMARGRSPRRARARGRSRPWPPGAARPRAPAASAAASPAVETESKSPIARSMRSPSASARSTPASAAITMRAVRQLGHGDSRRDALRQRRRRSRAPRAYLRWHYPDQVLRVGGALSHPLSPVVPELPVSLPPS